MEHAIGEIVTLLDGRTIEAVEIPSELHECSKCAWSDKFRCPKCCSIDRKEHKNIIYKEVIKEK